MIKLKYNLGYLYSFSKLYKKMRVFYLDIYKKMPEDKRMKVHLMESKISVAYKSNCEIGNEGEFHYACFLMAIKRVHHQSIDYDSIKLNNDQIINLYNKKSILKNIYNDFIIEMRSKGISWRNISQELKSKYNFSVSHDYLKSIFG